MDRNVIKLGMISFWTGSRVRLRGIEPDDWAAIMRFDVDEAGLGDLLHPPRSAERFRARVKDQAVADIAGDRFALVVESVETNVAVGAVACHDADPNMGWFEYGVTLAAEHRRKGFGAEAVVMLLSYMFTERRYHKCEARILAHKVASLALHRRLGFTEEGRLREHVFFGGEHHDLVMMGLLAEEFTGLHTFGSAG
ncbi:GNAT family protein [Streptomyces sp. NPDC001185]|uniref:GNAT family N-acetyltransferase n=1 Tax=Streptomyces sp. NPDC001185 TaxID=3154380 RepID=UPI00331CD1C9